MTHIQPLESLGAEFLSVTNPARYVGGEFGQCVKSETEADFTFAMAFPDVYEIAMSNQAVKIIYNGLNMLEKVRCERVFAPDVDFEKLLKQKNVPLYTLETGIPLAETDIIGFSVGYELGINGILSILDCGKIPILKTERSKNDPIILAGGCGMTNPAPFSDFIDCAFIGEAENELFILTAELATLKRNGASRDDLLTALSKHPNIWMPGKKAERAVFDGFGIEDSVPAFLPIASVKAVQDHGVVEIMRGCPNGCRFCHAGIYYRPQRMKPFEKIIEEADRLVFDGGCREISLTSLSSGDYEGIGKLLDILNKRYEGRNISFQLPSLRVNTFTLPILEKLAEVRKSGLTFAIETPVEAWQLSLNKEVYESKIIDIIQEAKKRGWSKAKFYFMVGLPIERDGKKEEEEIVSFLLRIQDVTRIQCNVNVGTFTPKPHTPYERVKQLSPEEAEEKLTYIRTHLPRGRFKVSTHTAYTSFLEGMLSRGDSRVGEVVLNAYKKGCRLDAWENPENITRWQEAIAEASWDVRKEILSERPASMELPWSDISLGVSQAFLKKEYERSISAELKEKCSPECHERCGVCSNKHKVVLKSIQSEQKYLQLLENPRKQMNTNRQVMNCPVLYRVIFQFSKNNGSELLSHLSLIEMFYKVFLRSDLEVVYTDGFNPVPRLELAATMSIGITSDCEIASCILYKNETADFFISNMNANLPTSIRVLNAFIFPVSNMKKRESLATSYWGAEYIYSFSYSEEETAAFFESEETTAVLQNIEYTRNGKQVDIKLPFKKDRLFRDTICAFFGVASVYSAVAIKKIATFSQAKDSAVSYFETYKDIAAQNAKLIAEDSRKVMSDYIQKECNQ